MRLLWLALLAAAMARAAAAFRLTSPAFPDGGAIPPRYACDGQNASPPLAWTAPPAGTRSLALIMADHLSSHALAIDWVVYNIPDSARGLPSRYVWLSKQKDGTLQGRNSANRTGYFGPCPGRERRHYYAIALYALDEKLPARQGMSAADLAIAIKGHVLAKATLTGTYRRKF